MILAVTFIFSLLEYEQISKTHGKHRASFGSLE